MGVLRKMWFEEFVLMIQELGFNLLGIFLNFEEVKKQALKNGPR